MIVRNPPERPPPLRAMRCFMTPPPRSASIRPFRARRTASHSASSSSPSRFAKRANALVLNVCNPDPASACHCSHFIALSVCDTNLASGAGAVSAWSPCGFSATRLPPASCTAGKVRRLVRIRMAVEATSSGLRPEIGWHQEEGESGRKRGGGWRSGRGVRRRSLSRDRRSTELCRRHSHRAATRAPISPTSSATVCRTTATSSRRSARSPTARSSPSKPTARSRWAGVRRAPGSCP